MTPFEFKPQLVATLRNYNRKQFITDLMAGIIVGIVALPLAIAFGIASGVTPEKGIITAIVAGLIVSLFGGSKVQIGGPTGAFIVIIYGIIQQYGIEGLRLADYAIQIKEISNLGVQVAIVIGGGNIFRGLSGVSKGFDRVQGDQMGMLATVINSLALNSALQSVGVKSRVLTAIRMEPIGEFYSKQKAVECLENGEVVIFSAGTGNPFFTTDTGSSLRAIEVGADIMLKGTRVDGIYTADPEKDSTATKFDEISYDEIYNRNLKVMDLTATTMCKENNMPIYVFNMDEYGNLNKVVKGEKIGTLVKI